jgi:hypothetical protein
MNKDLIKYGLIALGAYLIYQYIQKNGGISGLFGATVDLKNPTVGQTATLAQLAAAGIGDFASLLQELPSKANDVYKWSGSVWAAPGTGYNPGPVTGSVAPLTNVLPPQKTMQPVTPLQIVSLMHIPCTGTPVWVDTKTTEGRIIGFDSSDAQIARAVTCLGVTPPNPPPAAAPTPLPISQQMLNLAGTNSLDMFQWAYYFTQLTGQPSPVDPNAIGPNVYAGAGIVDSSTPTDVGTWLAIMQNQAPQLGLMGLGVVRFTPSWLM